MVVYLFLSHRRIQIIGTSGTVTTVAASHLGLKRYDRNKVDGLRMTSDQIDKVIREYLALGPSGRRDDPRIGRDRHALIMSGAAILQALLRVWPTDTNFMLVRVDRPGVEAYEALLREGVIVRPLPGTGLDQHVRVTIGTPPENERLIGAMRRLVEARA